MSWSFIVPVVTVSVLITWLFAPDARHRAIKNLPCPPSTLPLLGNTLDLSKQLERLHDWLLEQTVLHGGKTWRLAALGAPPLVVVNSVECFEDVLKTQFEVFDKGERMNSIFRDFVGEGIVAVDGKRWLQQRHTMLKLFTMRSVRTVLSTSVSKYLRVMHTKMEQAANNPNVPLNFGDICQRFTFDTFAEFGFGLQTNTLEKGEQSEFMEAMDRAAYAIELRFHQPDWLWKLKRFLNVGQERVLADSVKIINNTIYGIMYENLRRKNDPKYKTEKRVTQDVISLFLNQLDDTKSDNDRVDDGVDISELKKVQTNPKFLRDIAFLFLAAGKDTTSISMTWFLIELNRHPDVLVKIREELKEKLPQLFTDPNFIPSMDDVVHLVFMEAALRESLRLHPAVPCNAKEANRDTTLVDGTFLKKGTRVYIPSYALARLVSVWGPDAAQYNPDRWLEINKETDQLQIRSISQYKFVSFHAGPRICLGMRFAMYEMKTVMAFLLSKYEFKTVERPESYTYGIASLLPVKGPVLVNVERI